MIFSWSLSEQITKPVLISDLQTPAFTLCPLYHTTAFHNNQFLAGSNSDNSESTVDFILFLFYPGLLLLSRCPVPFYLFEDRFYIPFLKYSCSKSIWGVMLFCELPQFYCTLVFKRFTVVQIIFFCLLTLSWVLELHVELCASAENDLCVGYFTVIYIYMYIYVHIYGTEM